MVSHSAILINGTFDLSSLSLLCLFGADVILHPFELTPLPIESVPLLLFPGWLAKLADLIAEN